MVLPVVALPVAGFGLRPLRRADAPEWHAVVHDPRVHGPTSWPLVEVEALAARADPLPDGSTGWRWAIVTLAEDRLVGSCGATRWSRELAVAEVAYELAPAWWGRGVASAAVAAFLGVAASHGITRVEAHTWEGNAASARVLQRAGFVQEARLPAFRSCRGELRDFCRWVHERG